MPEFQVKIVRKEYLLNWYENADLRKEPSEETKRLNKAGHLGVVRIITARDKNEANKKAEAENPGFVVIVSDTTKLP